MRFEDIEIEIGTLLTRLAEQPHDKQELEVMLREKLRELRAFGMPVPQDLVDLEAALDAEMTEEARSFARDSAKPDKP